jgi:HPt (histidine-containing phosphotransfer) domain-containing protein
MCTSEQSSQPVLDPKALDTLQAMVGGDPAMLSIVIESFLTDSPRLMSSLRQAVAPPNAQDLYMAAHSLKSLGASFGATRFAQLCRELESLGQSGRLDAAAEWLRQIEREYEHVRSALISLRNGPTA